MRWAKNYRGEIVEAQRGNYSYGLECPYCKEPVYLRSGHDRRPHFAHFSNRAKPDCENYFPSHELSLGVYSQAAHNPIPLIKKNSLKVGLFLAKRSAPVGFEIFLRLPSLYNGQNGWDGQVVIQHRLGEKTLTPDQLTNVSIVSLSPQTPLFKCYGSGDLIEFAHNLLLQADEFNDEFNIFRAIESGGRAVPKDEALECGATYWIVGSAVLTPPSEVLELIDWTLKGMVSRWYVYETTLPTIFAEHKFSQHQAVLSDFFNRLIKVRKARAFLLHPYPHHIDQDGAYIYPQNPDVIFLKRSSRKVISIEGPQNLIGYARVKELSDDLVKIDGLNLGKEDVIISIDGVEQFLIRSEKCELIQPAGIYAHTETDTWNILQEPPLSRDQINELEVKIKFSNLKLATKIAAINSKLLINEVEIVLESNTEKLFIANGFGRILPESSNSLKSVSNNPNDARHLLGSEVWLYSLTREKFGIRASQLVRDYIESPESKCLSMLGPILQSTLMPYIHAAKALLHNQKGI